VLLLVLDTQGASNMSLHGYHRPTSPWLSEIAQEGTVFEHAIAPAPWTLPSHAAMFTGRYNLELKTEWFTGLDQRYLTIAEELRLRGYRTGGFVGNTIFTNDFYGLAQGFSVYRDEAIHPGGILESSWLGRHAVGRLRRWLGDYRNLGRKRGDSINREFLGWLDDQPAAQPFFAFLNYFDSHGPYRAPRPFESSFGTGTGRYWLVSERSDDYTGEELTELRDHYDGATRYTDSTAGALLQALRRRGVLDRTLVIITSDHGEAFGQNGWMGHGNSLYLETLWVPLIFRYPAAVPAKLRISTPVSLREIPATILDLAGLGSARFPGTSLSRHWSPDSVRRAGSDTLLSELGAAKSLLAGRFHFIAEDSSTERLYDFTVDPHEKHDLATGAPEILRSFRVSLRRLVDPEGRRAPPRTMEQEP
jgi:arylsulfatase A-like enzyme